jgi:hypothetical protein
VPSMCFDCDTSCCCTASEGTPVLRVYCIARLGNQWPALHFLLAYRPTTAKQGLFHRFLICAQSSSTTTDNPLYRCGPISVTKCPTDNKFLTDTQPAYYRRDVRLIICVSAGCFESLNV